MSSKYEESREEHKSTDAFLQERSKGGDSKYGSAVRSDLDKGSKSTTTPKILKNQLSTTSSHKQKSSKAANKTMDSSNKKSHSRSQEKNKALNQTTAFFGGLSSSSGGGTNFYSNTINQSFNQTLTKESMMKNFIRKAAGGGGIPSGMGASSNTAKFRSETPDIDSLFEKSGGMNTSFNQKSYIKQMDELLKSLKENEKDKETLESTNKTLGTTFDKRRSISVEKDRSKQG